MLIKTDKTIPSSEITDYKIFKQRRAIIKGLIAVGASGIISPALANTKTEQLTPTPVELIKNYTNYYEFTFNKEDSTKLAQNLVIAPWTIEISGEIEKPASYHLEDLLKQQTIEERVYRFRCVEGWSMVVPWQGFSLAQLLKQVKPLSTAKFVKFTSVYQPEVMVNQKNNSMLQWPYIEALRIDEAMHPLTLLATGLYNESLPKQNGAPLRLIVPWKYGFKSSKAIVKIELVKTPPITTWNMAAPTEYGFYANVNPAVSHPRWSQNTERLLGSGFFTSRRQTELFNGYSEQVASLYSDMDLRHFF
jgi:sulfoxide reductase catalytic subunit YedY